jgi:hypothetical protein
VTRQDEVVRIGTWNLAGRWGTGQRELLLTQDCDVWLLTEVREDVALPGLESHLTTSRMGTRRCWAGIFSRLRLQRLPDPHPASVAASGKGLVWCSSILPWRSCGPDPWGSGNPGEKTSRAVERLMAALPPGALVWGGDWNHSLAGRDNVGSRVGRNAIEEAVAMRQLNVVTRDAPHRVPSHSSIDHIAVPEYVQVLSSDRVIAADEDGRRLSDHDAYTSEIAQP